MNFKDALNVVYRTRTTDDELKNAFFTFSRMADLIENSYEEKRKLDLFFSVEKRLSLFYNLQNATNVEVGVVRRRYPQVKEFLSKNAFNSLIDTVVATVRGENVKSDKSNETLDKGDEAIMQANADGKREFSCAALATTTQIETNDANYVSAKNEAEGNGNFVENIDNEWYCAGYERKIAGRAISCVLIAVSITLLAVLGRLSIVWTAYQWVVSVCATTIFFVTFIPLSLRFDNGVFDNVLLGIVIVTNIVLFFVFRELYEIICYWVCAVSVIFGIFSAVRAFDDYCYVNGWISVACCALSVGMILLNALLGK